MAFKRSIWEGRFETTVYPCPHCKRESTALDKATLKSEEPEYSKIFQRSEDGGDPEFTVLRFIAFMRCTVPNCQEIVGVCGDAAYEEEFIDTGGDQLEQSYETVLYPRGMHPAPPIISMEEATPHEVKKEIRESFQLFWVDLDSCATSLRKSVELLLDAFEIPREWPDGRFKSLEKRLLQYKENDPEHHDTFDALRYIGNLGTHQGAVKLEALLDAFEIYEYTLAQLFGKQKDKITKLRDKLIAMKGRY